MKKGQVGYEGRDEKKRSQKSEVDMKERKGTVA